MKILVISIYYPPMKEVGSKRFFYIKQEFEKIGHSVLVLCGQSGNCGEQVPNVFRTRRLWFNNIQRNDIPSRALRKLWNRIALIDPFIDWVMLSFPILVRLLVKERIDYVIITGPPFSQFLHILTAKAFKKKVILDYRDPWFAYDLKRRNLVKSKGLFNRVCEQKLLILADGIVLNTPLAHELYKEWAPYITGKSFCVTNGIEYEPTLEDRSDYHKGTFTMIYAGNLYGNRRLCYIFDALDSAFNAKIISQRSFRFDVYGKLTYQDRAAIQRLGWTSSFVEHEYVMPDEMKLRFQEANLLYVVQGEDFKYSIPYKLYDYMQSGKRLVVITSKNSATDTLSKVYPNAFVGYIDDQESIRNAVFGAIQSPTQGHKIKIRDLKWENIAASYDWLLRHVR